MNILVLVSGYPSVENPYNCTWAHTRNLYYKNMGMQISVFVPTLVSSYVFQDIEVLGHDRVDELYNGKYLAVISHSPNIRYHLPILRRIYSEVEAVFLLFHGSESMYINYDYPKPYRYMQDGFLKFWIRNVYDFLKFKMLPRFILAHKSKVRMIFVSGWMKNIFIKNMFDPSHLDIDSYIINNAISDAFINNSYALSSVVKADFVTLRRLDESKYAIDLVVKHALANPDKTYHVYGRGEYFNVYDKPKNIKLIPNHVEQDDIPKLLNNYRCALMPTRCDAQGVMVCEIATFGMPIITSDIDVCHEMFDSFGNVLMLSESQFSCQMDLDEFLTCRNLTRNLDRFSTFNTVHQEYLLLRSLQNECD